MFENLLKKVARELKKTSVPYMVIGGQAVLLYGEPRLTRDIDITLGVGVEGLNKVREIVRRVGLKILVKKDREFVEKNMVLPTLDRKSGIRVDFIFSFSLYEKQAIQRGKDIQLGRTTVRFASLEDLVIHKVIAGRARDLEDVKSVLLKNPKFDSVYIMRWLKEFDESLSSNFSEAFQKIEDEINFQVRLFALFCLEISGVSASPLILIVSSQTLFTMSFA